MYESYLRQRGDGLLLIPRVRSLASFDGLPSMSILSFELPLNSALVSNFLLYFIRSEYSYNMLVT